MIYLEPRELYDKAILKIEDVVVYDFHLLIEQIMIEHECDYLSAVEWFDFNIECVQLDGWPRFHEDT